MNKLIGKRIVGIRTLTEADRQRIWGDARITATSPLLIFDDGSTLIAMADEEGNAPGAFLWSDRDGNGGVVLPDGRLA